MNKKVFISPEASFKNKRIEVEMPFKEESHFPPASNEHFIQKAELRSQFTTLAEQIAEHTFFYRNYKIPQAATLFQDPEMRFVSRCFPLSSKGMLLVDEPKTEQEFLKAFEKQKVLKKNGYRHIVLKETSTLFEALGQLGEL